VATSPHRRLPPASVLETRMLLPSSTGGTRRGELSPVVVVPGSWQCAWRAVRLAWGHRFPARGSTGLGSTSQCAWRPWSGRQGCGLGGTQGGIGDLAAESAALTSISSRSGNSGLISSPSRYVPSPGRSVDLWRGKLLLHTLPALFLQMA
jgi:hypothetical protein